MTKQKTLIQKFLAHPQSVSFSEIETLFTTFGFTKKQGKGSHIKYSHGKDYIVFSPHNGKIKDYQKKKSLKLLQKKQFL